MTEKKKLKCDVCGKRARHEETKGWIDFDATVHIYKKDVKVQWFKKKSGLYLKKDFCSLACFNTFLVQADWRTKLAKTARKLRERQTKKKERL